jgi:hypothetical protein
MEEFEICCSADESSDEVTQNGGHIPESANHSSVSVFACYTDRWRLLIFFGM